MAVELEEVPTPMAELEIILLPDEFSWRLRAQLKRPLRRRRTRDGSGKN